MKAIVLNQKTYELEIKDVDKPVISHSDVLVKLKATSLNHHELWTLKEKKLRNDSNIILERAQCHPCELWLIEPLLTALGADWLSSLSIPRTRCRRIDHHRF